MDSRKILLVSMAIVVIAALSLAFRNNARLASRPLTEDSFYTFAIARDIALGHGITVNGTTPTDGFQPLYTFLIVPIFIIFRHSLYAPLRLILGFELLMSILAALILGLITEDMLYGGEATRSRGWFPRTTAGRWVSLLYLSSLFVFALNYNGLETGFALLLYIICWRFYQTHSLDKLSNSFLLGLLFGFLVLARIDSAILVTVFVVFYFLEKRHGTFQWRFNRAVIVGGTSLLVSSPWWLYNKIVFGSFMPTSGSAYHVWIFAHEHILSLPLERVWRALIAISDAGLPFLYAGAADSILNTLITILRLLAVAGLVFYAGRVFGRIAEETSAGKDNKGTIARGSEFLRMLMVTCGVLVLIYVLTFDASWFYTRYFAPLILISIPLLGSFIGQLTLDKPFIGKVAPPVLTFIFLVAMLLFGIGKMKSQFYQDEVQLVRQNVPRGEIVASSQTGTLGYFRPPAVDLDGKVNYEAERYRSNLSRYLDSTGVNWLCDWPWKLKYWLGKSPVKMGWQIVGKKGYFVLYKRK